ncbi:MULTISPECIES: hypothetical protein [unclassified Serratia (in: enterobacteria)]|uniref:DUF6960 family protein n=1 Tax=unclassified Serratia (in: enterobacteria) TaxID=2647522 RepID=UPI0005053430|nr:MULTISPECIES: hypothetical protein [unclassified Serratia (in: enterobacteria)]KFK92337.1 hypothetical protein JV45_21725 [Serratia sp. Ag2]KFK98820.1 hypothetical protein IV04_11665 [Serratia sp. Ag1]
MAKTEFKGTFGIYPWFNECGDTLIKPQYLEVVKNLSPYGKVFYCSEESDAYITLNYGDFYFEVKPELYQVVDNPLLNMGGIVQVVTSLPQKTGVITSVEWHSGKGEPLYYLTINGKKSSKRYFSSDLAKV